MSCDTESSLTPAFFEVGWGFFQLLGSAQCQRDEGRDSSRDSSYCLLQRCLRCKVKDLGKMLRCYKPTLNVQIYFAIYSITLQLLLCFILIYISKVIESSLNTFSFTEEYLSQSQVHWKR